MNETDFIRQQLAAERSHLREILSALQQQGSSVAAGAGPVTRYLDWAGLRLVQQLAAHESGLAALAATPAGADLARISAALSTTTAAPGALQLGELVDAWSSSLDAWAGSALRVGHWRRAAHLTADSILEERQLYAAARTALGLR